MTDATGTYTLTGVTDTPITREAAANATVTYNITGNADTLNLTSDANSMVTITQTANVADVLNLLANGGTITLNETQTADKIFATVENGGKLITNGDYSGTSASGSLTYSGGGGSIIVGTSGTYSAAMLSQVVYGFKSSVDIFDDLHLKFSGVTGYSIATGTTSGQQTITINDTSGNFVFTTSGTTMTTGSYTSLTSGPLKLTADSTGGTNIAACFLAGVRILTPDGEVAVESISVGDLVSVVSSGKTVSEPVKWIGSRIVKLSNDAALDAYPVRVCTGAVADNIPHRDLLITSEHCLLVDDVLIPVRMLVNGTSIKVDTSIEDFSFFHIELEKHAILIANGMKTESYLDTGNRGNFGNIAISNLRPDYSINANHKSWATDAVAPLAVDRETVEPIWNRLVARSLERRMSKVEQAPGMVSDPNLRLKLDNGHEVRACWHDAQHYMFHIPHGRRAVRLLSRSAVPAEVIGPFVDDRRRLGVAVSSLVLWHGLDEQVIHPDKLTLWGWHHSDNASWTNGDAELDVPEAGAETYLDIHVSATMLYYDSTMLAA